MSATQPWYDVQRVSQKGSVILNRWRAERQASKMAPQAQDLSGLSPAEFAEWVRGNGGYGTGVVTERTAMQIGTVYACVALIGGAIASLPLHFYRIDDAGDRQREQRDEWYLFNEQPMAGWSAAVAWEYAVWSLLLKGDSFWRIHRASRMSPKIVGFEPLHPDSATVRRIDGRLTYKISKQPFETTLGGETVTLDQDDVLHIPGPGFDGQRGMSQISSVLKPAGGTALAADEYSLAFFKNSARPDFVLQATGKLDKDQIQVMRDQWADLYGGASRGWKPAILSGGLEIKPISLKAEEAQILETRRFQVEDLCRIFGVPPFMVGHTDKTTSWGAGVEQMSIGFVTYTLQRHLVKFEQEINRKVFRRAGRFCEFLTAGLTRGDLKSRNEAWRIALGRAGEPGWLTVNEVRRIENMPPVEGGDELNRAVVPAKKGPGNESASATAG